jgi:hypothetical protein
VWDMRAKLCACIPTRLLPQKPVCGEKEEDDDEWIKVSYNEIDKKWNLYRVYNYHLSEVSKGNTQPGFVDYHEFLFDVLENELHKTP